MKKIFLCLKIAEIDTGGGGGGLIFWAKRMILDIKTQFFKVKPIFQDKYPNSMCHSLPDSNFVSSMLL